jgi:hypothetical protein
MPRDAEEVLRIRLQCFDLKVFVSWPSEKNGFFGGKICV